MTLVVMSIFCPEDGLRMVEIDVLHDLAQTRLVEDARHLSPAPGPEGHSSPPRIFLAACRAHIVRQPKHMKPDRRFCHKDIKRRQAETSGTIQQGLQGIAEYPRNGPVVGRHSHRQMKRGLVLRGGLVHIATGHVEDIPYLTSSS